MCKSIAASKFEDKEQDPTSLGPNDRNRHVPTDSYRSHRNYITHTHLPDGFDFFVLLEEATLGVVTVLSELGGQGLSTLLFRTTRLQQRVTVNVK